MNDSTVMTRIRGYSTITSETSLGGIRRPFCDHFYFHLMDNFFDLYSCEDTYYSTANGECPIGDESLETMRDAPNLDSPAPVPVAEGRSLSFEIPSLPTCDDTTTLQENPNMCLESADSLSLPLFPDEPLTETDPSSNFAEQPPFMQQESYVLPEKEELERQYDSMVLNTLYEPSVRPFTEAIIMNSSAIVSILNSTKRRTYWGNYHKLLRDLRRAIRQAKGDGNHGPYSISRIAKVLLSENILPGCTNPKQALTRLCDRFNRKDDSLN